MNIVQQKAVDFHGSPIASFKTDDGQTWVAMKPIVEGMGLNWHSQLAKIKDQSEYFSCRDIATTGADGKMYPMTCIPLNKLEGWLFTVNPNRIKNFITRAKVELYKQACFKILHDAWTTGEAKLEDAMAVAKVEVAKTGINWDDPIAMANALAEQALATAEQATKFIETRKQLLLAHTQIAEDAPKVEVFNAIMSTEGYTKMSVASDTLHPITHLGFYTFMAWLRGVGIFKQNTRTPMGQYLDRGLFKVVPTPHKTHGGRMVMEDVTVVSAKGMDLIIKRWRKFMRDRCGIPLNAEEQAELRKQFPGKGDDIAVVQPAPVLPPMLTGRQIDTTGEVVPDNE